MPTTEDRGLALCLSGGGFRATLFHLGAVRRLNELGVLGRASTITSVSGGSILNGVLATRWSKMPRGASGVLADFDKHVEAPVRAFCKADLRTRVLFGTRLKPWHWPRLLGNAGSVSANVLAEWYEPLCGGLLTGLPEPAENVAPRFVFCATNVSTGACWHFHSGPDARMGDFYTGYCHTGALRVCDAVAASSAFPPGFAPLELALPAKLTREDPWHQIREKPSERRAADLDAGDRVGLTDGGVYDNLGVETLWERYDKMIVSDAGFPFATVGSSGSFVLSRLARASAISQNQVGSVRRRWLIEDFLAKKRTGTVWALQTAPKDFGLGDARGYTENVELLHAVRTDLNAFTDGEVGCLVNHGYSLADAAVRKWVPDFCTNRAAAFEWPDPEWSTDAKLKEALAGSGKLRLLRDGARYLLGLAPRFRPPT